MITIANKTLNNDNRTGNGRQIIILILVYFFGFLGGRISTTLFETNATATGHDKNDISKSSSLDEKTEKEQQQKKMFDFPPSVKDVFINIGSNLDPIMPGNATAWGPCARTIAVEPVVGCQIDPHPQVSVLHAAVAADPGLSSMKIYNTNGLSSSLAAPAKAMFWNTNVQRGDGKLVLVPVLKLSTVLYAIPPSTTIRLLVTDMQGYDFAAIKEAGTALKERVTHVVTEVWHDDLYTYEAENDLCRDFLPFFTDLGYSLVKLEFNVQRDYIAIEEIPSRCQSQLSKPRPSYKDSPGLKESNAFWVRNDVKTQPFPELTTLPKYNPGFSATDFQLCGF